MEILSDRVFDNLRAGRPSLGVILKGGVQMVDWIGQAGFDFLVPDMMFSRMDWSELHNMIRACHALGMAAYPRIQAYPWVTGGPDRRLVVDSARVLSLRADGVCMSVASAEEVRQVVTVTGDWHRGVATTSGQETKALSETMEKRTLILPLIEAKSALEDVDRIIDVEGLTGIFIALTDLTREMGLVQQYEHPEVLKVVDHIVERSRKQGLMVAANSGYGFRSIDSAAQRIQRMWNAGIQLIEVQTTEYWVFATLEGIVNRLAEIRAQQRGV